MIRELNAAETNLVNGGILIPLLALGTAGWAIYEAWSDDEGEAPEAGTCDAPEPSKE